MFFHMQDDLSLIRIPLVSSFPKFTYAYLLFYFSQLRRTRFSIFTITATAVFDYHAPLLPPGRERPGRTSWRCAWAVVYASRVDVRVWNYRRLCTSLSCRPRPTECHSAHAPLLGLFRAYFDLVSDDDLRQEISDASLNIR